MGFTPRISPSHHGSNEFPWAGIFPSIFQRRGALRDIPPPSVALLSFCAAPPVEGLEASPRRQNCRSTELRTDVFPFPVRPDSLGTSTRDPSSPTIPTAATHDRRLLLWRCHVFFFAIRQGGLNCLNVTDVFPFSPSVPFWLPPDTHRSRSRFASVPPDRFLRSPPSKSLS